MSKIFSVLALFLVFCGLSTGAQAQDLVCLYTQTNYQGAKFCFYPGQRPPNLDAFPLNDGTYTNGEFGSILVEGSAAATIYDSINYQAEYAQPIYINSSIPDLSSVWNSTIFSLEVEYSR